MSVSFSPAAYAYEAMKLFRDNTLALVRLRLRERFGDTFIETQLAPLWSKEKWSRDRENAQQVRRTGLLTNPVDDLELLDARAFRRIFENRFDAIQPKVPAKERLLAILKDIEELRNPIGHPGTNDFTQIDALRAIDLFRRAATMIFGEDADTVTRLTALLADATAPDIVAQDQVDEVTVTPVSVYKSIPPRHEIVSDFVGRDTELSVLSLWLQSDHPVWILEGDGGKGKTSLAYALVDNITSPENARVDQIIWLTAKRLRYLEGETVGATPDFSNLDEALTVVLRAYGVDSSDNLDQCAKEQLALRLMKTRPALFVLDDIDSLPGDEDDAIHFFTQRVLRESGSRLLMTTRRHLMGWGRYRLVVKGFTFEDTREFVESYWRLNEADGRREPSREEVALLHRSADGSPLFLEDILRLSHMTGSSINEACAMWNERLGNRAREYALNREFELLTATGKKVLLAAAIAGERISFEEIRGACGLSADEVYQGLTDLQKYHLVAVGNRDSLETSTFQINNNLRLLVKDVYKADDRLREIANALSQLRKSNRPKKARKAATAVQVGIRDSAVLLNQGKANEAEARLKELSKAYPSEGALLSQLGWFYTTQNRFADAAESLERALSLKFFELNTFISATYAYIKLDNLERATQTVLSGLSRFPEDSQLLYLLDYARMRVAFEAMKRYGWRGSEKHVQLARQASNVCLRLATANGPLAGRRALLMNQRAQLDADADRLRNAARVASRISGTL